MDGSPGTFNAYYNTYNLEMQSHPSACDLSVLVDHDFNTRSLKIKTMVTAIDSFENAYLRYAVAESHIYHLWYGMDSLHHVVRKMLPDFNGIALPPMNPNEIYVDSQAFDLSPSWNEKNCYLVVFVQRDDLDKPVLRSAKFGSPLMWLSGDTNGDNRVDMNDIIFLLNYLLKSGVTPNPLASGDPNNDCIVNVFDLFYLINYLFREGSTPLKGCAWQ